MNATGMLAKAPSPVTGSLLTYRTNTCPVAASALLPTSAVT